SGFARATRAAGRAGRAPEPRRILILGGTRFIGPHQVKYALDRGHEVSIFTRGITEPPFYHDYFERVEHLIGDRDDDLAALESGEWDAVIDNSASVPRWVEQSAGLLADRAERYLFVSSISAYADYEEVGLTEDYPLAELEDPAVEEVTGATYGGMKALCEEKAREAFGEDAIVVRPGLIVGPGDNTDRWTYWPVRIDRGGEVLAPNSPDDPVQNIDARDLSEWMVRLVEEPGHGGTYNGTGPAAPQTFGGMLGGIRSALDADASFTWVATDFLEEHGVSPWGHMTNWIPPVGSARGMLQVSIDRALAHGLTFRPLADTARDTLAWWKTLPEERRAEPRAGLPSELEAEVLAAWHARG
ncbi:MAG: NAD-dependent epimerase/dehydratase family protein, partial [Gemmatimonadota bacterium]|nr:NAD-dependent epimerase/dehydratase family protein [Gemmatimonadota bacterium]